MPNAGFLIVYAAAVLVALAVALLIFSVPAIQAKRRGYSFIVWMLAGLLAYNPIYLLVVLATVPHRARQKMRLQFAQELDAKLSAAGITPSIPAVRPVGECSLGDLGTMGPRTTASHPPSGRSVSDEATRMPGEGSLGDEATRG